MKKQDRTYKMYFSDLLTAMTRIADYISGYDLNGFKKDHKTVDAVIRNFEIIGEASKNIPFEIKSKHPEVPWTEMYLLRNKVIHEYFGVDSLALRCFWFVANSIT